MSVPIYVCFRQNFCSGNGVCVYKPDSQYKVVCDCNDDWFGFDCRKEYPSYFNFPPEYNIKFLYVGMIITLSVLMGIIVGVRFAYKKAFSSKKNTAAGRTNSADIDNEV